MTMKYWPPIRPRPTITQREFRGENKLDPFSIDDSFASETVNLTNAKYPALTTRPGFSIIGTFGRVLGMGVWKEIELHVVTGDGKWRRLNADGTWTELASGLDANAEWTFTNFKGDLSVISLIGTNGVNPAKVYSGTTVSNLAGVPAGAKYITQFSDRLFAAVGNELRYSAYRMATDWTAANGDDADAGYIVIESPDGEQINSIQGGLTKLTITKPSAVYTLFGYSPSDYAVRPVTIDTGQFNHKSGITLDGWLYQLYDTGLHRFPGTGFPVNDFSERVKSYFTSLSASSKTDATIGSDGRKLYLSISGTIIEYDPKRDTFYPWTGIQALHFAQVKEKTYIGDTAGRVLQLGGSTNDVGVSISWKWVSKPFTSSSMAQVIRWMRSWVTIDLPINSTLKVHLSKSATGDDWVQAGSTIVGSGSIERKTIYFPSNIIPNASLIRVKFEGTGPMTLYEFSRDQENMPLR